MLRSIHTLRTRSGDAPALAQVETRTQLNLSLALLKLGRWQEVIDVCDEILKKNVADLKATLRKAHALRMLGRLDEAVECAAKLGDQAEAKSLIAEAKREKAS